MFDWNVFSLLDFLGSFYILNEFNNSGRLFHWKLNSLFKQKFDVHAVFTSITKFLIVHSFLKDCFAIWKKNKIRPVQAESSKFELLLFDQGFKIVIPPRSPASVPEPIGTPSDGILHQSNYCLLRQLKMTTIFNEMRIAKIWSKCERTLPERSATVDSLHVAICTNEAKEI